MLLSLVGEGLVIAEVHYGGGRHVEDIAPNIYTTGLKMNFLGEPVFAVAIAMVKISVGYALLRIAGHTKWRYLIITIMIVMGSWAMSSIFVSAFHKKGPSSIAERRTD